MTNDRSDSDPPSILQIAHLSLDLVGPSRLPIRLVSDVSLEILAGRVTALIGESGSGKSVTALAVLGLLPPAIEICGGSIKLDGQELRGRSARQRRMVQGGRMGAVFQDPTNSLNPTMQIGDQIAESRRLHCGESRKDAWQHARTLLDSVHLAGGDRMLRRYPHELSGGMQQRVMIAMAIASNPSVLLADEPTTALDVTIQAEILELIRELCQSRKMGVLLVTHDLGVVAAIADDVAVMYAGEIVERAPISIFHRTRHPYSRALIDAVPTLEHDGSRLVTLPGRVPPPEQFSSGCRFQERCRFVIEQTCAAPTTLALLEPNHWSRCSRVLDGSLSTLGDDWWANA